MPALGPNYIKKITYVFTQGFCILLFVSALRISPFRVDSLCVAAPAAPPISKGPDYRI